MLPVSELSLKDNSANPSPLGLFGFGLTTVLLNVSNAGWFPFDASILAMGICYGGLAQVIAGILESRKNNTFGLTAFVSYGMFWLSLVVLIILPKLGWIPAVSHRGMGVYLILWALFTLLLFVATLRISRALQVVFLTLVLLFVLLAAGEFTQDPRVGHIAGYVGIICGLSAIYTAAANLLNEVYGHPILPVGLIVRSRSDLEAHS